MEDGLSERRDFGWAVRQMREGRRVRRIAWGEDMGELLFDCSEPSIVLATYDYHSSLMAHPDGNEVAAIAVEDAIADDWELA